MDFNQPKNSLPWNEEIEIVALPIYKNLSWSYWEGHAEFLDEDTLLAMAEDVAEKVNMELISGFSTFEVTADEKERYLSGIIVMTDLDQITIDKNGEIFVGFSEGVQLPKEYRISDTATKEEANATVNYLLEYYSEMFPAESWIPACYVTYDWEGNPSMNYCAVGTGMV
ncbi:MAG: hypothetical protein IJ455_05935 [Agathobacter sp.]|nr:hypothetical protein [Agathobacter sp.]